MRQKSLALIISESLMFLINKIGKVVFFIVLTLPTIGIACANSEHNKSEMNAYYGHYKVADVQRYRGGLTTVKEANNMINADVVICLNVFNDPTYKIMNPVYIMTSEKVEKEEGVVPPKNSVFYGFMPERDFIHYIEVFKTIDAKYFYTRYEVIGQNKLMKSFDGFFYKVDKITSCQ